MGPTTQYNWPPFEFCQTENGVNVWFYRYVPHDKKFGENEIFGSILKTFKLFLHIWEQDWWLIMEINWSSYSKSSMDKILCLCEKKLFNCTYIKNSYGFKMEENTLNDELYNDRKNIIIKFSTVLPKI